MGLGEEEHTGEVLFSLQTKLRNKYNMTYPWRC